jgi:hypothetical protein
MTTETKLEAATAFIYSVAITLMLLGILVKNPSKPSLPDVRKNVLSQEDADYFQAHLCAGLTYNQCFGSMDQ